MSYESLARRMQVRPITKWPGELSPDYARQSSRFDSSWSQTQRLLDSELYNLRATAIVLQVAIEERDFRLDGLPRAQARAIHPGVILGFNRNADVTDRMQFATDRFRTWQDNVRAIALGMEALRKVDRYGITAGGQQYAGFRELPSGDDGSMGIYTKAQALAFIADRYAGDIKAALKATHPDRGGDPIELRKVVRAKELIGT